MYLDQYGVAGLEDVVHIVQREPVLMHRTRPHRRRLLKGIEIPPANDLGVGHQLVPAHLGVGRVLRVLVNQLHHHVVVAARRGSINVCDHLAGQDHVLLERRQFPHRDVLAAGHEALIFGEPVKPLRALAIGGLDGPMAVGNRVGRIAQVAGFGRCGRVAPAQQPGPCEMQAGGLRFLGREMGIALPGVGAGLETHRVFEVKPRGVGPRLVLQIVSEEPGLDLRPELLADGLGIVQAAQVARGRRPGAMPPGPEHQEVLPSGIMRLQPGIFLLRPVHVFLVVSAAHGERRHGDRVQRVFDAPRRPHRIIGRVFEEQLPGGQQLGAGFLHVLGKAAPLQKIVEAVARLAVLVLAVVHVDFFLAGLHPENVVVAVALPEGPVVEEVVAHPHVDHGRLRGNSLHRRMRVDARHHGQKSRIAGAHKSRPPVVPRHVLEQPGHGVVGVGALVDGFGVLVVGQSPAHDELTLALVPPANVLGHEDVALARQLRAAAGERRAVEAVHAVRGSLNQEGKRRGHVGRLQNYRMQRHTVAHRDHDLRALVVVKQVMDRRAGASINGVRLQRDRDRCAPAGLVHRKAQRGLGVGDGEFESRNGVQRRGNAPLGLGNQLAVLDVEADRRVRLGRVGVLARQRTERGRRGKQEKAQGRKGKSETEQANDLLEVGCDSIGKKVIPGPCGPPILKRQPLQKLAKFRPQIAPLQRKLHRRLQHPQLVAGVEALALEGVAEDLFFLHQR